MNRARPLRVKDRLKIFDLTISIWFPAHDPLGLFGDSLPVPSVCNKFFQVRSGYFLAQGCFDAFLVSIAYFLMDAKTPLARVVFMRWLISFFKENEKGRDNRWGRKRITKKAMQVANKKPNGKYRITMQTPLIRIFVRTTSALRLRLLRSYGRSLLVLICWTLSSHAQGGAVMHLDYVQQGLNADEIMLAECLQGLANRSGPNVYYTTIDYQGENTNVSYVWLNYLTNHLGMTITNVVNLRTLIRNTRNLGVISGLVLYDSQDIGGAEAQTALTMAAQLNALPVTDPILNYQSPGLLNKGTNLCFSGLPVLRDIRDEWGNSLTARRWEVANLLAASSTNECFFDGGHWFGPIAGKGCCESAFCARDYAVKLNSFCFDFPVSQPAYSGLFSNVMAHVHAPAAILGVWPAYGGGESEGSTTLLISEYGNYWLLTHEAMNISFLSAISVAGTNLYLRKNSHHLTLDPTKYYVIFQTSEGDTIKQAWEMPATTAWLDPNRGNVPVAWGLNPSLAARLPLYLQFLHHEAGAKDTFFSGPNGIGYTWLKFMGANGRAALGAASEPYFEATGLQLVDIWGLDTPSLLTYASNAPAIKGFTGEVGPTNALLADGIPLS
jgi:hypothetical protein